MSLKKKIIDEIIRVEGGYSNNPNDSGGETMYGITIRVARENGYTGLMTEMPRRVAEDIYGREYWDDLNLDEIEKISIQIAEEVADTAVNCGQTRAALWLQQSLNLLNRRSLDYPNIAEDGKVGFKSTNALRTFLHKRGVKDGSKVILSMLNTLQGAHYIKIASQQPDDKDEDFIYGWFLNRVKLPAA